MTGRSGAITDPVAADVFDGLTARRHPVSLTWDTAGLALAGHERGETIGWDHLTTIDWLPDAILLGRSDQPGWRLKLPPETPADLIARLPPRPRFGRWIDRFGFAKSLICGAAISAAVFYAVINSPNWLGRRLPVAWETGMSDDSIADIAANTCHTPASDAALAGLVARLDRDNADGHLPTVRVELVKLDLVNAVALPGGRVLVFDGLVKQIASPDALAGVIGHEIGHVRERHVMQAMLREFGLTMVLGGLKSGMSNTFGRLTALRFSREAETEADTWSRTQLAQANISPIPTANFFTSLEEQSPDSPLPISAYLNSHPDSASRAIGFQTAYRRDQPYRPALDEAQFRAVRQACELDTKAKPWVPKLFR